ncbi:MAG: rhodanese-like domain-containing protein, partial [Aurantibacter sp.]
RLSRVGFDGTIGYLGGGFKSWEKAGKDVDTIMSLTAEEVKDRLNREKNNIFDVRKESEYQSEHVVDAHSTPLGSLNEHLAEFPADETFYVHCAGGYRSVIAASILKSRGFHNLIDLAGGFDAIKNADIEVTEYVCPTTL